jgi:hypothetical protein
MRIMCQVFFEMNSYLMILVKIGVIHRNLFGGALFLQPTRQRVFIYLSPKTFTHLFALPNTKVHFLITSPNQYSI